jgi:uncharacterized membrane protein YhaH (DUF805 family)
MNWYLEILKHKYADFSGRARRMEYWSFVLFNVIFAAIAMVLDNIFGIAFQGIASTGPLYLIYVLATFIPSLAVCVRRLHDTGKSGWMLLVSLIPFIGAIWLLVLFLIEGDSTANEYGPNPKEADANGLNANDVK